ncbi:MAG: phage tail tape measure protein, partial [Simkaniaceae bacterium]|nr:phage tail tape measure protein [Simkaniaceae bacterium]
MSTQVNSEKIENLAVQQGSGSSKAPAAASVGVSTTALLSALQSPSGSIGDDYSLISFMFSEDEAEEVQKLAAKQAFNLEQLSSDPKVKEDASDAAGATKGTGTSGKNAIAESSKLMSQLQNKAQNQLVEQLENEKKLLENELQAAQKQEELWQKFMKDWTAYQNNPDYDNFAALMDDIKDIYGKNSAEGIEAEQDKANGKNAWDDEQHWQHESGWDRFTSGQWWDPDDWSDFQNGAQGMVDALVAFATLNPAEFSIIMQSMGQMAKNQVKNLMTQIEFMNVLIMIVAGGGNPVAQMQALMNVMMQMGMQNNEQSTQRTQILNNFTIANNERQAREIEKQIDKIHKSEHHHGGIFGFFEDLADSIVKFFENPIGTIVDAVKNIGEMFKKVITDIKEGHLFKALEDLTVALVVTALVFSGGPIAALMMGTQVGKDLENCVKLVVDTIGAIMETVYDLLDAAATDSKDPLDKIGGVWEKVAQNPELELVLQVVAVAVIIASALSGQLYLAAFMTVLLALSMSGALTDLTNAIAQSLGDSATDKLIAAILVTVIVSVCSLGVGAAGAFAEVAAEEAAQVATEVGEQVAQSAADAAADA